MDPIFAVFEGVDRCGKTRQAELLRQKIASLGLPVRSYGTPDRTTATGGLAGRLLRGHVGLAGDPSARGDGAVGPLDEELALQCVLTCNRYEVAWRVRRDLAAGISVVCVRWWPSALVYAGDCGLDAQAVRAAESFLPEPDCNILLDAGPGAEVVAGRLCPTERYERQEMQARLAEAYRRLWEERSSVLPHHWVTVSAAGDVREVEERVWGAVRVHRAATFGESSGGVE